MHNGNGNGYATAQEIRDKLSIPYSKINYYTTVGLFSIVKREGNKRFYSLKEVESTYKSITELANEGYPLVLIRKKLLEPVAT